MNENDLNEESLKESGIDLDTLMHTDRLFRCEKKRFNVAFLHCPLCEFFPCKQLTPEELVELEFSPLIDRLTVKLKPRRIALFIIKYLDGSFKEAPELDTNHPDPELMKDVDTVFQIGKELVPVIVLKPKPKEDRDEILEDAKKKSSKKAKPES